VSERKRENTKLMSCYEIKKINWERSNRKCLMVIKERILEYIRGAIPDCATVVEYLEKVESQFYWFFKGICEYSHQEAHYGEIL
jgi:hypothetical protein